MAKQGKKFDIQNVMVAAGAGGVFGLGMAAASRKVPMIADNFLVAKTTIGTALGAGLVYFGSGSESMKAAGYAIIGNAAGSGAAALVDRFVSDDTGAGDPEIQGVKMRGRLGGKMMNRANLTRAIEAARRVALRGAPGANNPRLEAIKKAAGATFPGSEKMGRVMGRVTDDTPMFPWLSTMADGE